MKNENDRPNTDRPNTDGPTTDEVAVADEDGTTLTGEEGDKIGVLNDKE